MNPKENGRRNASVLFIWFLGITIGFSLAALGCQKEKEPIKLGFVGCLTGRLSDLGTSGRNGVLLAVEEANKAGGINGRPIELIVKDDKQDRIDLVIIDMVMPGITGGETFDRLKAINPQVKTILSSGYSVDGEATDILNRGCLGFIQKPFSMKALSQKLREILG